MFILLPTTAVAGETDQSSVFGYVKIFGLFIAIFYLIYLYKKFFGEKCPKCKARDFSVQKNIISKVAKDKTRKGNGMSGKKKAIFTYGWTETTIEYEYLYTCNSCGKEWKKNKIKIKKSPEKLLYIK